MEQFVVPQFIDVEDKIIGPVTVRQFVVLIIGGGSIFLCYKIFTLPVFLPLAFIMGCLIVLIGFVKINGRPFHMFMLGMVQTMLRPKIRIWNKLFTSLNIVKKDGSLRKEDAPMVVVAKSPIGKSRLSQLALTVDTGGLYRGNQNDINIS